MLTGHVLRLAALAFFLCLVTSAHVTGAGGGTTRQTGTPNAVTPLTIPYPPVQRVGDQRVLTCLSLMEADLTGSPDKALTKGIEGKVTPGQNGVTLSLKNESTLTFLSDAAAKSGKTGGATFTVIKNDATQLVAYLFDGQSMNSLALNKVSGLAIWSKIRSTFPVYDAPTSSSSYLVCR